MNDIVLKLDHITKSYGKNTVLDDISMEIKRGEIYGLVGNNGAGKTTIMRIITGNSITDEGTFSLFGATDPVQINKNRKRTGVLIEDPGFIGTMTAEQNMEYFRRQFGIPGKESIKQALKDAGLGNTGNKRYKNFSLGMKQRLGIALALLNSPELLILDEPINGLDPEGIIEVRNTLKKVNQTRNTTILISSHILAEMSNVATFYGFLSHGKLLEQLSADELLKRCSVYLDIIVDDPKKMCILLEQELDTKNYKIYPDSHIHLFDHLSDDSKICEIAVNGKVGLHRVEKKSVNLENYYMSIVEEGK